MTQPLPVPPRRPRRTPLAENEKPYWPGAIGFIFMHLACLGVFLVGWSWTALGIALFTYVLRAFGLTGGYHRYFSHRTYKTSRFFQFVMAFIGAMATQKGPLWWAAHHRHHHRFTDTEEDVHSPGVRGFFWAHVGWIIARKYEATNLSAIPDFARYPELRFLDRFHLIPPITLGLILGAVGWLLQAYAPGLGTGPGQLIVWGLFISTVALYHATFMVNSVSHMLGSRRFKTRDDSRNNLLVSLMTLGEGWHNNHHRYPSSERQGFVWYELDVTHYILKTLSFAGIVWDLRAPPDELYEEARETSLEADKMAA